MFRNKFLQSVIIFSIIISIFSNCKNSAPIESSSDKGTSILKGEKYRLSGSLSPMDIQLADSLLIIENYGDKYWFHVYNKNTLSLLGKFGLEGRGPSEYIAPLMMDQQMKIRDSSYLVVYDGSLRRVTIVNILKAIDNVNYHPKTFRFHGRKNFQLSMLASAVLVDDSLLIGTSGHNYIEGKYFCYDIINDKITWEPFYPIPKVEPRRMFLDDLYRNHSALRPDSSAIAAAFHYYKRIEILDKTGKLKRAIVFHQDKDPDFSDASSSVPKGSHTFFIFISVTQDYIYALDIDHDADSRKIIDTVSLIRTTWEDTGLDPDIFRMTPNVSKIAVDEENKMIYGANFLSEYIYIYKMSK